FCPSYEGIPLAPLFTALRNRARARARLLLIAHSPGAYVWEWAVLRPLLAEGDLIITPSENARAVITFVSPALAPFTRVVPHPMAPLPRPAMRLTPPWPPRLVSLGRLHASKLLHRQIEALEVLRRRGRPVRAMDIAGSLG